MQWVSFCDKKTWLLNDEIRQKIQMKINNLWGVAKNNHFLGPQPVSIERKHLKRLFNENYWVCEKTDGERFLLVAVNIEEPVKNKENVFGPLISTLYVVMVNRKNEMFLINTNLDKKIGNGTILDGELVKTFSGKYNFIVYDCVSSFGDSNVKKEFKDRIDKAVFVVSNMGKNNLFDIKIKQFSPMSNMKEYVQKVIPKLTHLVDGYIFTPNDIPIRSGTHFDMFKWKEKHKNTVDFLFSNGNFRKQQSTYVYIVAVMKDRRQTILNNVVVHLDSSLHSDIQLHNTTVIECEYTCDLQGKEIWKGLFVRKDKSYPNNMLTYTKTKLNIFEAIELSEFMVVDSHSSTTGSRNA
jgi:hypothetical protein